ncbi:MAG: 1-acyl-sn-glycerol-3-phosphate acyltransferase [Paracoccaceae bacterium]
MPRVRLRPVRSISCFARSRWSAPSICPRPGRGDRDREPHQQPGSTGHSARGTRRATRGFSPRAQCGDYKPVAPFMNASGSVKVFRQQDGRAHEGSLEDSFADAAALLADGGVLAVFPEGRTHDDPALLAFKTGTARIAQLAETRHGPLDWRSLVGLDYEVKNRFHPRLFHLR